MRLRTLFLLAAAIVPAIAHADTFTTTITSNGLTLVFPNVGGPSNYTFYSRASEIQAAPLYVSINGAPPTAQGELDFFLGSSPSYHDLNVIVPFLPELVLNGPDLIGSVNGIGFYSFPGTYNLADANGTPYLYVVTDNTLSAVPEPPSIALCAIAALCLLVVYRASAFALLSVARQQFTHHGVENAIPNK